MCTARAIYPAIVVVTGEYTLIHAQNQQSAASELANIQSCPIEFNGNPGFNLLIKLSRT